MIGFLAHFGGGWGLWGGFVYVRNLYSAVQRMVWTLYSIGGSIVLYSSVWYYTVQHFTVQYGTVQEFGK